MWIIIYSITIIIFAYFGFTLAKMYLKRSCSPLSEAAIEENVQAILTNAHSQREIILTEAALAAKEQYQDELQHLEAERNIILRLNEKAELELNQKQSEIDKFENLLLQSEQKYKEKESGLSETVKQVETRCNERKSLSEQLGNQLEHKAGLKKDKLLHQMQDDLIASEKLGITKWLMDNLDSLKSDAQIFARDALSSIYLRYQPQFIWPKSSFTVQLPSADILQKHFMEDSLIVAALIENTDTSLSALAIGEQLPTMLKISGGAGVDKEVIRLSLEEIVTKGIFQPEKVRSTVDKHRKQIEKHILKL